MALNLDILLQLTFPGMLFLLTLGFGFWVSQVGKPYNGFLFNVHKLTALGTVVLMVIQLIQTLKKANSTAPIIALLVVGAVCVVALFSSGALLSIGNTDYDLTRRVHRIALVIATITLGLGIYWLGGVL